ncbi:GPI ethanolamine phosphate transferase 1 [Phytophthora ramorum]|uniref:GPI ethanolamine phosphate transferase 1 n=1 Tax=Phytophthora ramorum TaxID=164328 RepID=UPI0030B6B890|nr:GPI ethanolamine phosphate transferase 1 [Phytophthora ramorum]
MGNIARLLLLGVAFHALCILSIFDIHFQSPVESSIPSNEYTLTPPAKRVIIFTLDGCRVDKLFKAVAGHADRYDLNAESASTSTKFASNRRTPYLGDVMRNRGSWGVSHNHAPTESRPCHVALTAGMYEDPHAVTKNWKQHPVPFDSVFNQSSSAFIYGNKDVAPMLARHAPQATEEHYTAKEEVDIIREDTTLLDVWAYEKMKDLFARGAEAKDPDLYKKLHQDKLVIYCHYLGTDLAGPKFGADSREYLENIAVVDELIEKTEKMIDAYFGNDRRTAYVLNSDHGMDLRGDHGDKDPSKTRTAIIAWGAGIHRPVVVNRTGDEGFDFDVPTQSKAEVQVRLESQETEEQVAAQEWRTLIHFKRKDVMQIDVAPLISALAGLPYPRNSVGVLPFTYLTKNKYRVNAMRANAQQLYQHALRKEEVKHANRGLLFIPYAPLHSRVPDLMAHIDEALNSIPASDGESHAIHNEAHHVIEKLIQEMIDICRNAIIYYQRYDCPKNSECRGCWST